MKKLFYFVLIILLVGCSSGDGRINYTKAKELIINNQAVLVDIRTEKEYLEKHIDGAVFFNLDDINEENALSVIGNKDTYVIVYCKSGKRSSEAYTLLKKIGYKNVYDLGAMSNWKE